ncbi:MAG: hypothetical protein K0U66_11190 [Gammaproteobacteria bacterium]|nr:hypothetical protein [Gammaproteobacteria bacterium]
MNLSLIALAQRYRGDVCWQAARLCPYPTNGSFRPCALRLRPCIAVLAVVAISMSGCVHNKILSVDSSTGYFSKPGRAPSRLNSEAVTVNVAVDLDAKRALIVVPEKVGIYTFQAGEDFMARAVADIDYFGVVMNTAELMQILRTNNIDSADLRAATERDDERALMSAAAKAYQPFLWLHWEHRRHSRAPRDEYYQLILTDARTLQDYFIVETKYQYTVGHSNTPPVKIINHQQNHYPMLNALIDYIRQHSIEHRQTRATPKD